MLEKKPGYPLIKRLRGIIILGADYNWEFRKILSKRLFQNMVNTQTLMTTQQARPGFQSIIAALNKVLVYNHWCLTQREGTSFDNDVGCYDRIDPPQAMISCRCMGLPKLSAKILTTNLQ